MSLLSAEFLYDEQTLLQCLSNGDETAFDKLFCLHWDHVYSTALAFLHSPEQADDVAQEIFLALWQNRASAHTIENLKAYLAASVKFNVYNKLRRLKVEQAYHNYLTRKQPLEIEIEQESNLSFKDLNRKIYQAVSKLPAQQKRAFTLSRDEGLSHEQISKVMGVSKKTVKDYIVRSLAYLRPLFEHSGCAVFILLELLA